MWCQEVQQQKTALEIHREQELANDVIKEFDKQFEEELKEKKVTSEHLGMPVGICNESRNLFASSDETGVDQSEMDLIKQYQRSAFKHLVCLAECFEEYYKTSSTEPLKSFVEKIYPRKMYEKRGLKPEYEDIDKKKYQLESIELRQLESFLTTAIDYVDYNPEEVRILKDLLARLKSGSTEIEDFFT